MKLNINEIPSKEVKNALLGDTTGKIKTFAILSAENPMDIPLNMTENKERIDKFKSYMINLGLQYIKITGMYNHKENSFVIYNISYNDALFLASKFAQKSFFFAKNDFPAVITYYETSFKLKAKDDIKTLIVPKNTYREIETSREIVNKKDANNFFSRYGDFKYFDMNYFKESVEAVCGSIINEKYEYYIKRAVDDRLTPWGRAIARRHSRRKDW